MPTKIYMKSDATPKFAKAWAVPIAVVDCVNAELDRLEWKDILKKMGHPHSCDS